MQEPDARENIARNCISEKEDNSRKGVYWKQRKEGAPLWGGRPLGGIRLAKRSGEAATQFERKLLIGKKRR